MRLSHHAKNNLRLYGGTAAEVESVVKTRLKKGLDRRGVRRGGGGGREGGQSEAFGQAGHGVIPR